MAALILWVLQLMENKIIPLPIELLDNNKFAVGNDLVFIPGFKGSCTELFKNKVYTANELEYCERFDNALLHYASTWAAKEAVYKAIKQLDKSSIGWKKIEILREKTGGRPSAIIHQVGRQFKISLSISHDGDYAWAIAIIEVKP